MIMLTRRGRVVLPVVLIVALVLLTWKTDLRGSLVEYGPPLHPKAPEPDEPLYEAPSTPTTPGADANPDGDAERLADPGKPNVVDPSTVIGPFTVIPEGAYSQGFTLFDNLYLRNGTFYVIAQDASRFPPIADMISAPHERGPNIDTTPTSQQMQFLGADDVESMLGKHAIRIEGLSVVVYDPPQFLTPEPDIFADAALVPLVGRGDSRRMANPLLRERKD
ncbi:hypothetical protein C0993_010866 [Termitomyces sp. T159_Od127]|nr:hypothetical protein C0993_010866 [Termitomyces sp. T159_Od127]